MNKNTKIIIIIIAALIVLTGVVLLIWKNTREIAPPELNVTLFKCHIGKEITDTDLDEIKELANNILGKNKVLEIEKGSIPTIQYPPTDENGEKIDLGDSLTITFSVLDDQQKGEFFTALANKYGITGDYLIQFNNISRADYK